nr:hypothetical protein [Tanacetum cinerariifolium]
MQEELLQFKIKNVWVLVDCPKGVRPIGTKWVLKNKKDERGIVIRNKDKLVAQVYTQEEGIDYEEVFAPVARIEAIRLFLAYASFMGFIVYQMDVKSAFLYGIIDEEAPRAWYGTLSKYLLDNGFQRGTIDQPLFIRKHKGEFLLVQVHSDVRSANTPMDKENPWGKDGPGKDVELYLYRSMIRSLMYLTASRPDIMFAVCACTRYQVTPKECHLHAVKRIFRYLKGHPKLGLWYPNESPSDMVAYSDSDYGGATQDRKSTTRGCQFLGRRLISWKCKKQTIMATSTTEAKYVQLLVAVDKFFGYKIRCWIMDQETKIIATVDGKPQTIYELSLRRHLKLNDEEGISSLPDAELFENLSLMGYNILPNQSNIATVVVCLATNMVYNFSKMIFDDEPASLSRDDKQGEAFPTVSSLDAGQDRENIAKTSAMPHESSPRVPFLDPDEGSMQQRLHKLIELCTSLQRAYSRGCSNHRGIIDIGEELGEDKSTEKGSNDTKEMINVLSLMDAANILSSGGAAFSTASVSPADVFLTAGVPTVSGSFSTVSAIFTTASIVTPYIKRSRGITIGSLQPMRIPIISAKDKGKEKVIETEVPKKKKLQEQIDAQEESERVKRPRIKLDQGSSKRVKISYISRSEPSLEQQFKGSEGVSEEELKGMMHLVPLEEVYIKALQLYDTCGVHHVSTKNQEIFMLVEEDYPLRKGLATVMIVQDEELFEASSPSEHLI